MHKTLHRGVEQLVARQAHNLEVARSSPAPATKQLWKPLYRGFFYLSMLNYSRFHVQAIVLVHVCQKEKALEGGGELTPFQG